MRAWLMSPNGKRSYAEFLNAIEPESTCQIIEEGRRIQHLWLYGNVSSVVMFSTSPVRCTGAPSCIQAWSPPISLFPIQYRTLPPYKCLVIRSILPLSCILLLTYCIRLAHIFVAGQSTGFDGDVASRDCLIVVVPNQIGLLSHLKVFQAETNQFTGHLPTELGLRRDVRFLSFEAFKTSAYSIGTWHPS
jgi:hypothetical protein